MEPTRGIGARLLACNERKGGHQTAAYRHAGRTQSLSRLPPSGAAGRTTGRLPPPLRHDDGRGAAAAASARARHRRLLLPDGAKRRATTASAARAALSHSVRACMRASSCRGA
eukprot:scaffold1535_cov382-Prasinococcus_capsulatus_cf.AAC.54